MITLQEVAILDRNSELLGVPTSSLMENAGRSIAKLIYKHYKSSNDILIFCGSGNNGGDGFVAARYLSLFVKVFVVVMGPEAGLKTKLTRNAFFSLKQLAASGDAITILFIDEVERGTLLRLIDGADVIVDSMLGSGISGDLREPYRAMVDLIGRVSAGRETKLVAVDVPTGWGSSTFIDPDLVITFHDIKKGYEELAERTEIVDIGIPPEAELVIHKGHMLHLPKLKEDAHKGVRGKVLVVGGGPYNGAPVLAAFGASETGIDLIHLAVPNGIFHSTAAASPDFIVHPLKKPGTMLSQSHLSQLLEFIPRMNAVVLGPGLGRSGETIQTVMNLLGADREKEELSSRNSVPCLLDADALFAVAENLPKFISLRKKEKRLLLSPLILTPHEGEFQRLLKGKGMRMTEADIREAYSGKEFTLQGLDDEMKEKIVETKIVARKTRCVILRKGPTDIITDGETTRLNTTGTSAMSVGGTGDVLSGICGGLLAQGLSPLVAASLGAYINGKAGERAFEKKGRSMKATNVVKKIYKVLKEDG